MSDNDSNNVEREEIAEDRPQMRSVAMMSSEVGIAAPAFRRAHVAVSKTPFGAVEPASLSRVEGKVPPAVAAPSSTTPGQAGETWTVKAVNPVPAFYHFERTHASVDGNAVSPQVIARRITDCMKRESIAVLNCDSEGVR